MARNNDRRKQPMRIRLINEMRDGIFSDADRLPRESDLAEMLGISRTQLRDILSLLDREGFISRIHGVGTLINRHVLDITNRTDIEVEFNDTIRNCGMEPGLRILGFAIRPCDQRTAEALRLTPGAEVLTISRLVLADGHPAVLCENSLDKNMIIDPGYTEQDFLPTIFDFLERFCDTYTFMDIVEIQAAAADSRQAELLQVAPGAPMIFMDEVDYDQNGRPVLHSRHYYADGNIKHVLVRKKL